jgi:UDP-N-acetylglucosamine--N-acetylmuramyl-(pentapeptide) pyrophosphoryl-undecaprenol N-acetylglucosamine transferase
MNLYVTGGHLTPALAVIDELQKKVPKKVHIFFVGREFAQTLPPQPSQERREITARRIPFFAIHAAKFHRTRFWLNLFELPKLPVSFFTMFMLFRANKPDVILTFGGYMAFPVCVMGKLFKAKIIIHEQTRAAGLANEWTAYLADTIAVANEASIEYFPKEKTVVTGNPIRESLLKEYKTPPEWFPKNLHTKPFLYITGGSQGSQIINQTISVLLPKLLRDFIVIHQCGTSQEHVYLYELEKIRESLPEELQPFYIVREWIDAKEVSYLMRHAMFVISRAGANTVEELTHSGTPSIFIPLAFAYNNEQEKNAKDLVDANSALCLLQKDLLPETLYSTIQTMMRRYDFFKQHAIQLKEKGFTNGTRNLIRLFLPDFS